MDELFLPIISDTCWIIYSINILQSHYNHLEVKKMERSILKLETFTNNGHANTFRAIFKTQHGRVLFLSLDVNDTDCTITDCFYIDRNQGRTGLDRYSSKPLKLQTFQFQTDNLISVIEAELNKKFYGVEFIQTDHAYLSIDQYLQLESENAQKKYRFLIMVGDGGTYNELPVRLRTRLKNKLHRAIFVELAYYKNGNGVVKQCHYYDRKYRRQNMKVTPPLLTSCFFPYTREAILNLLNYEICCDFTHMIVTSGVELDSNTIPLCGAL